MSDLFTTTPPVTVLGVTPFLSTFHAEYCKKIYILGSTRYTVSGSQDNGDVPLIMKSTDGGATWSGPLGTPPTGFPGTTSDIMSIPDAANAKIHFFMHKQLSPAHTYYFYFDTGTDTFSTPIDSGHGGSVIQASMRSDGTFCVVQQNATGTLLEFAIFASGSWGSWTTLATGNAQPAAPVLLDSSDKTHILYSYFTVDKTYYNYVDASNSFGSEVDTGLTRLVAGGAGPGVIYGTKLLWPMYGTNLTAPFKIQMIQGDGLTTPTWTLIDVATLGAAVPGVDYSPDMVMVNGVPWIIWVDNDAGVSFLQVNGCCYNGSTFGTVRTLYDVVANPPTGTGSEPLVDRALQSPSVVMTGTYTAEIVVHTDVTYPDEDESLVWLSGTFPTDCHGPAPGGQMNRFSTSSVHAASA